MPVGAAGRTGLTMLRVRGTVPLAVSLAVAALAVVMLAFSSTLNPVDALLGRGALVTVPDVEGSPLPRARSEVEDLDLVVTVQQAFSLSVPRGSVIRQDPPAGKEIRQGASVNLVVSQGANRVEMPDAVGRPLKEVRGPLEAAGVEFEVVDVPDERIPEGVVIAQSPDPGVTVTGEDSPRFEVSSGPAKRPVPEVLGLSLDAAAFRRGDSGFELDDVRFVDSSEVAAGAVVDSEPAPGTVLDRDDEVTLVVSNGPPAVPVPDLVNTRRSEAVTQLEALGFVVTTASRIVGADRVGVDAVFEQYPPAGTPLRPGQPVTIVVGRVLPEPPPPPTTTLPPPTTAPGPTTPPNPSTTVAPTTTTRPAPPPTAPPNGADR
jgi:eukaryotic-like serine/threonine-protein kinase